MHIRDANLCVVERGQNIGNADADVFGVLGLDDLFCAGVLTQKFSAVGAAGITAASAGFGASATGAPRRARLFSQIFLQPVWMRLFVWFGHGLFGRSSGSGFRLCLLFFGSGFLFSSAIQNISGCRFWHSGCVARPRSCADLCACGRWSACAGLGPAIRACAGCRDSI